MSNRAYLIRAEESAVPIRSSPGFKAEEDILLQAPYHIPLLWFFLFGSEGVRVEPIYGKRKVLFREKIGERLSLVSSYDSAIKRLSQLRDFVNSLFESSGGLNHHVDMLLRHLSSHKDAFIHVDASEISDLDPSFINDVKEALRKIEERDKSVVPLLVKYSTIMPERVFITLDDAKAGKFSKEDMWNYFRILGEAFWGKVKPEWA